MKKFLNRAALIIFAVLAVAVFIAAVIRSEAKADSITVGWWNQSSGTWPSHGINTIYSQQSFNRFTLITNFGTFNGVLSTFVDSGNYEAAINNIFNTGFPDTGRIYVSFSGIVTPGKNITHRPCSNAQRIRCRDGRLSKKSICAAEVCTVMVPIGAATARASGPMVSLAVGPATIT